MRKATLEEQREYAERKPRPLYPIRYIVKVDGHQCPVEWLGGEWSKDDPQYEIRLPEGFHHHTELTHGLLCQTVAEVKDRAKYTTLEPCNGSESCYGKVGKP